MRRIIWITLAAVAALVAAGAATGIIIHDTQPLEARFEAQAIGDPHIIPCPLLGRAGVKIETDYRGTFTTAGEELVFTLRLEQLLDGEQELGAAEGTWTLTGRDGGLQGGGELVAIDELNELHGMLLGTIAGIPPEPEGTLRLLANFSASLSDGGRGLTGAIGDPNIAPNPGVVIPAGNC
jgi:hypothetical protein